jgi:predicted GIY-YIG superfamily endonuclease
MPAPKRFVYILKSENDPDQYYVGVTSDPDERLRVHNAGLSHHTAQYRPWRTLVCVEFDEEEPALRFERYLKTGYGREFARRHFRQTVRQGQQR